MTGFPPRLVAKYRPVRELAAGGFGTVWECTDAAGRAVAVKLPRAAAVSADELGRFMAEARLTARLAHPHVVAVHDCSGADEPVPWIAYELLPGPSLRHWLSAARPQAPSLVEAARQIASALAAAHHAGVVHRDIKPENVLAGADGLWKVTDFGVARFNDNPVKTKTGVVLGTPAYLAPEIIAGERATPASDLYALGVVLYEGLAGRVPHATEEAMQLLLARLSNPPDPVSKHAPGAPPALADLVDRMVAHDPAERLPTAGAVLGALEACLADGRTARSPAQRRRSRPEPDSDSASRSGSGTARSLRSLERASPANPRLAPASPAAAPGPRRLPLALAALALAAGGGLFFVTSRSHEKQRAPEPPRESVAAPTPSIGVDPRLLEVDRYARLATTAAIPIVRWVCDEAGAPPRMPLAVVAPTPERSVGLHWLAIAGAGAVTGLPEAPEIAGTVDGEPPEARVQMQIYETCTSKQVWDTDEPQLRGGDPLAQRVVLLRNSAEVPTFMNLFEDKTAGVRLLWHVKAREVRDRTTAVLQALEAPLAGPPRWDAWHHFGWVLGNTDQRAQGRRALLRALRIWPTSPWSWIELARIEERERRLVIESRASRADKLRVIERMELAASQAYRHLPKGGPPFLRRLRDDANALHRQATEDRRRLQ